MENLWKEQKLCVWCKTAMKAKEDHGTISIDLGGTLLEIIMPTSLCCGDCTHHVFPFSDIETLRRNVKKFARKNRDAGVCSMPLRSVEEFKRNL